MDIIENFSKSDDLIVIAFIVDKCNRHCIYCYNDFPRKNIELDLDRLFSFISDICQSNKRKIDLRLIGGEPMLHKSLLQFIKNIFEKLNNQVKITIFTNFESDIENYNRILEFGVKFIATNHLSKKFIENAKKLNIKKYRDNILCRVMFEYDKWNICKYFFSKLYDICSTNIEPSLISYKESNKFNIYTKEQLLEYLNICKKVEDNNKIYCVKYENGDVAILNYNQMTLNNYFDFYCWKCNAGLDYIYIDIYGDIYPCQTYGERHKKKLGSIYSKNIIDTIFKAHLICNVDFCACDWEVPKCRIFKLKTH